MDTGNSVSATTQSPTEIPSETTLRQNGGGGAGGCPAFDASKCDLNCISTDEKGCLHCQCLSMCILTFTVLS